MTRIRPGTIVRAQVSVPTFSGPTRSDAYVSHVPAGSWHLVLATDERLNDGYHDYTMVLVMPIDAGGQIAWAYMKHMVVMVETT